MPADVARTGYHCEGAPIRQRDCLPPKIGTGVPSGSADQEYWTGTIQGAAAAKESLVDDTRCCGPGDHLPEDAAVLQVEIEPEHELKAAGSSRRRREIEEEPLRPHPEDAISPHVGLPTPKDANLLVWISKTLLATGNRKGMRSSTRL